MRGLSIALAMNATEAQALVKYVTNAEGHTTDVLVPLSVWEALLEGSTLEDPDAEAIAASIEQLIAPSVPTIRTMSRTSKCPEEIVSMNPSAEPSKKMAGSSLMIR
jgi:hypothetical protein